jgi:hypothetical protein
MAGEPLASANTPGRCFRQSDWFGFRDEAEDAFFKREKVTRSGCSGLYGRASPVVILTEARANFEHAGGNSQRSAEVAGLITMAWG